MYNLYILTILFLLFCLNNVKAKILLNAIAFSQNGGSNLYLPLLNQFNEYARNNTWDIEAKLTLFSELNSTKLVTDYEDTVESVLRKQSAKYDLVFYDNIYTTRFGPYLLNIKGLVPEEHLDLYKPGIASKSCVYDGDKWVGLPITIDFAILYTNHRYTEKYGKPIPKTWEELIETSQYIIKEEAKLNNTNLMAYNGLFSDLESGTCSLHEFIYSYRKSVDADYPEIPSKESIDALKMIKRMKEELSNDEEFKSDDDYTFGKIMDGNFIFLKFWYFPYMDYFYRISAIPGVKEGISGSSIGGFNLGINGNINEKQKDAAIKAFTYITSKKVQKQVTMENLLYTAIPSLYDEEDVCEVINCEFFKSIQLTPRPRVPNYTEYSEKYRRSIFDFLYGDKSAEEVLNKINDMTKVYSISLDTQDTFVGLIFFIICISLSILMLLSLLAAIFNKDNPLYDFLPKDFWFVTVLGSIIILYTCFLGYGEVTEIKCHLKPVFLSIGCTFALIPVLYELIINFQEENKIVEWIRNRRNIFLLIFTLIDLLLILLTFITSYTVENKKIKDGKIFDTCKMNNGFGSFLIILIGIYKILITLAIIFLIFIEWNIRRIYYDVRFISLAIYIDILSVILLFIVNYIKITYYVMDFALPNIIYVFISVNNYMFIYGFRIVMGLRKVNEDSEFLKKFRETVKNSESTNPSNSNRNYNSSTSISSSRSKDNLSNKILNLHYQKTSTIDNISKSNSCDIYPMDVKSNNSNSSNNIYKKP